MTRLQRSKKSSKTDDTFIFATHRRSNRYGQGLRDKNGSAGSRLRLLVRLRVQLPADYQNSEK